MLPVTAALHALRLACAGASGPGSPTQFGSPRMMRSYAVKSALVNEPQAAASTTVTANPRARAALASRLSAPPDTVVPSTSAFGAVWAERRVAFGAITPLSATAVSTTDGRRRGRILRLRWDWMVE